MTTEENKHKEEVVRATQLWECGDITREQLEYIFPQLAESGNGMKMIRNFPRTTSLNTTNDYHGKYLHEWYKSREKEADVEYIRTDAFIEKADEFISTFFHSDDKELIDAVLNSFHEHMKLK